MQAIVERGQRVMDRLESHGVLIARGPVDNTVDAMEYLKLSLPVSTWELLLDKLDKV